MREILFRGKQLDNGEWVYGEVISCYSGKVYIFPHGSWGGESDRISEEGWLRLFAFEVDPETIGQYTGLRDKNGVKIFEGDVVQRRTPIYKLGEKAPIGEYLARGKVVWDESSFTEVGHYTVSTYDHLGNTTKTILFNGIDGWHVIGNIHDNPEL